MKSLNTKTEISTARYQQSIQFNIIINKILHSVDHLCKESLFTASVAFQGNCYYNSIYCSLVGLLLKKMQLEIWLIMVVESERHKFVPAKSWVWKQKEVSLVTFVITELSHKHPVWARVTRRVLTSTLTRFILYFLNPSPRIW